MDSSPRTPVQSPRKLVCPDAPRREIKGNRCAPRRVISFNKAGEMKVEVIVMNDETEAASK